MPLHAVRLLLRLLLAWICCTLQPEAKSPHPPALPNLSHLSPPTQPTTHPTHTAEGQKRKRQEEGKEQAPAAAPTAAAPAPRRPSVGSRLSGPGAEKALAAAVSQSQASAERPSKVPRTSSGYSLGGAEKGEAPAPEDVPEAAEPATRALRIDGFVRPFTERQVTWMPACGCSACSSSARGGVVHVLRGCWRCEGQQPVARQSKPKPVPSYIIGAPQ